MIHDDKDGLFKVLERTSGQTDFPLELLEKDYYITLLLSGIHGLSEDLIFKGGTCLSKIYYSYYRLSEDLDFSILLPDGKITRSVRRRTIKPIKDKIQSFVRNLGLGVEGADQAGRNESTQYVYHLDYDSVVLEERQVIKLEISLRFNPILPSSKQKVGHKFLHPFTGEPLLDGGAVRCLALKELVAEKMRAASSRLKIAPRDFYDLGYLAKSGFNFRDQELLELFRKKLAEDGFESDLKKYRVNLGRSEEEIKDMEARIEGELLDILKLEDKKTFHLRRTLDTLNEVFKDLN